MTKEKILNILESAKGKDGEIPMSLVRKAFEKLPERKTGRWIKAKGSWATPGGDPVWECSECGKGVHVYGIEHGTYGADIADGQWVACPNCGAIMESTVW